MEEGLHVTSWKVEDECQWEEGQTDGGFERRGFHGGEGWDVECLIQGPIIGASKEGRKAASWLRCIKARAR